jgi:ABC-type phosphate transport system substrate-binding protein
MKRALLHAAAILLAAAGLPAELGLRVVVNEANPVSSLSREDVSELFLKKTTSWPDGTVVLPVDQFEESEAREAFNRNFHHKSGKAVRAYWQQRIFSGRDVPPPEKDGDASVIEFVRRNRGAIGYVSAAGPVPGVKIVAVAK